MKIEVEVPYDDIPHFPLSTVQGHRGSLIFGTLSGKKVVAMSGRFHVYEGYETEEIVFPIRVLKKLGVQTLFLSNAAGGVNPDYKVGNLMIISDHISLFMPNPLIGKNYDELGPRFTDMSVAYTPVLIENAKAIAAKNNFEIKVGVYAGVTGPTYETPAEYKLMNTLGADAVGMSTVTENIVARHMGMDVFAISVITDIWHPDLTQTVTHEEVLVAAREAEPRLAVILKELAATL
jgi:purine-nucleoside phosphorylase